MYGFKFLSWTFFSDLTASSTLPSPRRFWPTPPAANPTSSSLTSNELNNRVALPRLQPSGEEKPNLDITSWYNRPLQFASVRPMNQTRSLCDQKQCKIVPAYRRSECCASERLIYQPIHICEHLQYLQALCLGWPELFRTTEESW